MPPRTHDMGGRPGAGPIDRTEHQLADWEVLADALNMAVGTKGIRVTDESRRAVEDIDAAVYQSASYYERWIIGLETLLAEKNVVIRQEIDRKVAEMEERWGAP